MNNLIFGKTWEEIQAMQMGAYVAPKVNLESNKPMATNEDIKLLQEKGIEGLVKMEFFGVIDRLVNSGIIEWE